MNCVMQGTPNYNETQSEQNVTNENSGQEQESDVIFVPNDSDDVSETILEPQVNVGIIELKKDQQETNENHDYVAKDTSQDKELILRNDISGEPAMEQENHDYIAKDATQNEEVLVEKIISVEAAIVNDEESSGMGKSSDETSDSINEENHEPMTGEISIENSKFDNTVNDGDNKNASENEDVVQNILKVIVNNTVPNAGEEKNASQQTVTVENENENDDPIVPKSEINVMKKDVSENVD